MCSRVFNQFICNIEPDYNCAYAFQHFSCILKHGKPLYKGSNNLRNRSFDNHNRGGTNTTSVNRDKSKKADTL